MLEAPSMLSATKQLPFTYIWIVPTSSWQRHWITWLLEISNSVVRPTWQRGSNQTLQLWFLIYSTRFYCWLSKYIIRWPWVRESYSRAGSDQLFGFSSCRGDSETLCELPLLDYQHFQWKDERCYHDSQWEWMKWNEKVCEENVKTDQERRTKRREMLKEFYH